VDFGLAYLGCQQAPEKIKEDLMHWFSPAISARFSAGFSAGFPLVFPAVSGQILAGDFGLFCVPLVAFPW